MKIRIKLFNSTIEINVIMCINNILNFNIKGIAFGLVAVEPKLTDVNLKIIFLRLL